MDVEQIIKGKNGTIVDVRTQAEYEGGHCAGSINIPLQEIPNKVEELKNLKAPLILCCASGNRSAQAHGYLVHQGIECCNGGAWYDVEFFQSQNV